MAEQAVVESDDQVAAVEDDAPDTDFDAGFSGTPTEATPPATTEKTANEGVTDDAGTKPAEDAEPAPEYVQVTKQELESLKALSTQIEQIRAEAKKGIDTAHGRYGELVRKLQEIQSATPAGYDVEVTDDIVADLSEEFPELGQKALSAFKKFAGKLKGTQPAGVDAGEVEKKIVDTRQQIAREVLSITHEGWEEVVGLPDKDGKVPDTEYRRWLAQQPEEYRTSVLSTWSAAELAKSITKFSKEKAAAEQAAAASGKAAGTKAPAAKQPTRSDRLAAAVTPKGESGAAPGPTEDDEFEAGFKSG